MPTWLPRSIGVATTRPATSAATSASSCAPSVPETRMKRVTGCCTTGAVVTAMASGSPAAAASVSRLDLSQPTATRPAKSAVRAILILGPNTVSPVGSGRPRAADVRGHGREWRRSIEKLVDVRAREGAAVANHGALRADGVQLAPEEERPEKLHHEQLRIGVAQAALVDQPLHDLFEPRTAALHPLQQVDAAVAGEAHAVGHEDPEQLLLAWHDEAAEDEPGELLEDGAAVGDRLLENRGEPLDLVGGIGGQQRLEERFLAGKVVVQRAFADADGTGHVAEARAEVALFGEQGERGVKDRLTGALAVGVDRAGHEEINGRSFISASQGPRQRRKK